LPGGCRLRQIDQRNDFFVSLHAHTQFGSVDQPSGRECDGDHKNADWVKNAFR
jgi:hypothetical protein